MIHSIPYEENTAELFKLFENQPWAVFLDSCYPYSTAGRYDIIAFQPKITLQSFQDHSLVCLANGDSEITKISPLALLKKYTLKNKMPATDLPFIGGAIGYFSYDLARVLENLPNFEASEGPIPLMQVGIYDSCIVVDHQKKQTWFISDSDKDFSAHLDMLKKSSIQPPFQLTNNFKANFTKQSYTDAFNKIKHYIHEGDCYQINLTQQFSAPFLGSTWNAYQYLRNINPSPYAAYLNFPETTIMSFSPEEFIRCKANHVITRPIKGTRPRSDNPTIDMQNKNELLNSEKDHAENLMIVDLLRNDLGKVCEYGSIHVSKLFSLESFTNVHHLVSTIEGNLQKKYNAIDLLSACFPGGSITGTPKIRAMEIIEEIEPNQRNIYCGSIGYINYAGDMDLSIAIRTLYTCNNIIYCSAGGAIVADSEVDAEYQEGLDKIKILLRSLERGSF